MIMRKTLKLVLLFAFAVLTAPAALAQGGSGDATGTQQVLAHARAALASEAKLKTINGFSVVYNFRRLAINGQQRTGEIKLDVLLPDKFLMTENRNLPRDIGQVISRSLLNGQQASFDIRTTTSEVPIVPIASVDPAKEQAALMQSLRREHVLNLLQLMLMTPTSFPADFTYVGEAQAIDGSADVLDVKGPDNFKARLFLDRRTHRLVMLSYGEPAPPDVVIGTDRQGKLAARPKESTQSGAGRPADVQVQLRFSDYRLEDGIYLPHLITKEKNGQVDQEMELKSFKANPTFEPAYFDVKQKR